MKVDRVKATLWIDAAGEKLTVASNADANETELVTDRAENEIRESEALLKTATEYRSCIDEIRARRNKV